MPKSIANPKYFYLLVLAGVFLINLFLKISFLDSEPFWYDEMVSVKASLLDFGHIKHMSEWDNNPPFYYYCLWVWLKLFGISEFKARILSVLFSALSACLLFAFLKKYFNYLTGISAAILYTLHDFSYEYSHESRCYSLVVLLVLASTLCFFNFIEKKGYWSAFWLVLLNFLIIYTHYIAGIIILFQILFIIFTGRNNLTRYSVSLAFTLIFVAIRFTKKQFLVMLSFNSEKKSFWLETSNTDLLKDALANLFSGSGIWLVFMICFWVAIGFILIKRKQSTLAQNRILLYSLFAGAGSILMLFLLGHYKPLFLGRYLLFTVPFLIIPVSWFLSNTNKFFPFLFLLLFSLQIYQINLNPLKPMDLEKAVHVIADLRTRHTALTLVQTKDITALFSYYFDRSVFLDYKNLSENLRKKNIFEMENSIDLQDIPFKTSNSIIFCQTYEKADDSKRIFDIFKQNNFVFATTKSVKGVKISLLKKL